MWNARTSLLLIQQVHCCLSTLLDIESSVSVTTQNFNFTLSYLQCVCPAPHRFTASLDCNNYASTSAYGTSHCLLISHFINFILLSKILWHNVIYIVCTPEFWEKSISSLKPLYLSLLSAGKNIFLICRRHFLYKLLICLKMKLQLTNLVMTLET